VMAAIADRASTGPMHASSPPRRRRPSRRKRGNPAPVYLLMRPPCTSYVRRRRRFHEGPAEHFLAPRSHGCVRQPAENTRNPQPEEIRSRRTLTKVGRKAEGKTEDAPVAPMMTKTAKPATKARHVRTYASDD
jgi:hypothetical protein